jgi:hypothetical protein
MRIEIHCSYSDEQLDRAHQEVTEVWNACTDANHRASLGAALRLIDEARAAVKATPAAE